MATSFIGFRNKTGVFFSRRESSEFGSLLWSRQFYLFGTADPSLVGTQLPYPTLYSIEQADDAGENDVQTEVATDLSALWSFPLPDSRTGIRVRVRRTMRNHRIPEDMLIVNRAGRNLSLSGHV